MAVFPLNDACCMYCTFAKHVLSWTFRQLRMVDVLKGIVHHLMSSFYSVPNLSIYFMINSHFFTFSTPVFTIFCIIFNLTVSIFILVIQVDLWEMKSATLSSQQLTFQVPSRLFLKFGGLAQVLFSMDQVKQRLMEEVPKHDHLHKLSSEQCN